MERTNGDAECTAGRAETGFSPSRSASRNGEGRAREDPPFVFVAAARGRERDYWPLVSTSVRSAPLPRPATWYCVAFESA